MPMGYVLIVCDNGRRRGDDKTKRRRMLKAPEFEAVQPIAMSKGSILSPIKRRLRGKAQ